MYLARSHIPDKLPGHLRPFLRAVLLAPLGLPESVCGEVIEYEYCGREGERLLGHRAVCNEVGILPGKAEHPCCRLSSNTIQQ